MDIPPPHVPPLTLYLFPSSKKPELRADRTDQILPQQLIFEHASGEYFIVRSNHVEGFGALFPDVYSAEFRIGADGKVSEVGIGWEEEDSGKGGREGLVEAGGSELKNLT
jgi:hypothetical protein